MDTLPRGANHTAQALNSGEAFTRPLTVHVFEYVEYGQYLPVVGDQCLPHQVGRHHQVLQDLQGGADHLVVTGVEGIWGKRGEGGEGREERGGRRGEGGEGREERGGRRTEEEGVQRQD